MRFSSKRARSTSFAEHKTKRAVKHPDKQSAEVKPCIDEAMLLREMQHRVVNSLQIVASILSLKARTVKSEDARFHLMDAYNRIMSIAAVQRQLLVSSQSSMIRIDSYLSELSESLVKSLTEKVRLSVVVEGVATIASNKAGAIGLVMTELITNALKHAFPQGQRGNIIAAYRTTGSDWSLSVSDDGVGIPNLSMNGSHSGYGAKIVNALARELDARVIVQSSSKGTRASLIHVADCSAGDPGTVH